jgi:hypothetical protein
VLDYIDGIVARAIVGDYYLRLERDGGSSQGHDDGI